MTKMIKMSLMAAVAVAGMTTTASAQNLEDAIKGVDVSGMLRYRYDDTKKDNTASTQSNEYTMKIVTKSKVNDIITANVQVEASGVNAGAAGYNSAHATSDATGDRDVNLVVSKANFAAHIAGATVTAGKQSVPSPFIDNTVDDNTRGTGAVALIPAGPVTIAAGHFTNFQNISDSAATTYYANNITAFAVLGKIDTVSFDAWHVDVDNVATAYSIGAKASIAGVNIDARHSTKNPDAAASKDSDLTKLVVSSKIGSVSVVAGVAMTSKDNTDISLDGDKDTQAGFVLWQANAGKLADATAYLIGAGMEVMPGLTLDAKYVTASAANNLDVTELLLGATYTMTKNFAVHTRYSMLNQDNGTSVDTNKGRLELKYTF